MQMRQVPPETEKVAQATSLGVMRVSGVALLSHTIKRWLHEPLVHFLLMGAALFIGYQLLHPQLDGGKPSNRIELTEDDVRQMSVIWMAQGRSAPTQEQIKILLENKIREEILYREALALGLDKDDTIVKRRLAQKMDFLAEDVSALREPASADLKAWFEKNTARFALPPRASFRHLYFSPDKRGAQARSDAEQALAKLAGAPANAPAATGLADRFMFQEYYADRSQEQLAKEFGPKFAQALLQLKPGAWEGPIESGYGWHLIWIDSMTPSRVPPFEEIEPTVKSEWLDDERAESKRNMFEALRARYEVIVPKTDIKDAAELDLSRALAAP